MRSPLFSWFNKRRDIKNGIVDLRRIGQQISIYNIIRHEGSRF